jgi:HEPN domain-containing protein
MRRTLYTLVGVIALALAGCATEPAQQEPTQQHTKADAESAILAAEQATDRAASVGFEWRDTRKKLLDKAAEAVTAGDYDKAVALANQAKHQSQMAYQQYLDQKDAKVGLN